MAANIPQVLVSHECGVTRSTVEGHEEAIEASLGTFHSRLFSMFGKDNVTFTEHGVTFPQVKDLQQQLAEGHFTHYVTSEGLDPRSFQSLKERHPDLKVLKVTALDREAISSTEKVSRFVESSQIQELTRFETAETKLEGEIDAADMVMLRFSRHPMSDAQSQALQTHFPQATVQWEKETPRTVDGILESLASCEKLGVAEAVLPGHMLAELVQRKPAHVSIIRAQMNNATRPPTFEHYTMVERVIVEMQEAK